MSDGVKALRPSTNGTAFGLVPDTSCAKSICGVTFTGDPRKWWDNRPRHVAYFQPGDVWAVDSRQVAHQIFYGRRAISIDFTVDTTTMLDPGRHYLALLDRFRRERLGVMA